MLRGPRHLAQPPDGGRDAADCRWQGVPRATRHRAVAGHVGQPERLPGARRIGAGGRAARDRGGDRASRRGRQAHRRVFAAGGRDRDDCVRGQRGGRTAGAGGRDE